MKNTTKTLLSIAIIAALPFTAHATQTIVETNTPAAVGANGTVKKAAAYAPYQTATIGEHDDEHIATTAYVKGAYNDAIAAVNKVDDSKQNKLIAAATDNPMNSYVQTSENIVEEVEYLLDGDLSPIVDLDDYLLSAGGVLAAIQELYQNGVVEIRTTWGNESATAPVQLKNLRSIVN